MAKAARKKAKKESNEDKQVFYITEEGLKKLKKELKHYKEVRRKEVAERIKEAIAFGDLSENDEYKEAKNEQAFIEGFIVDADFKIRNAKIIDEVVADTDSVQVGSTVVIKNVSEEGSEKEEYKIVGFMEADSLNGKISTESPVGNAVLGRAKGEKVEVKAPVGVCEYEILEIK